MAARPAWKGFLKISLVSFPVEAYVGSNGENPSIKFNQLHKQCHSRIRYVKTCPIHGEIPSDEIVSGYEYAKGEYVEIDPDQLPRLRPEGERSITVQTFVPSDAVDPSYFAGKTYYLLPDGDVGRKPYQLICEAMEAEGLQAIARMIITRREHVVRVRPAKGVLTVDLLEYAAQVRSPGDFTDDLVDTHPAAPESKLTRQLIRSMSEDHVDLSQYNDTYADQVKELIEAKVEGKELVTVAPAEEPRVVNLMDALKKSMVRAKSRTDRPPRRKVPSATKRAASGKSAPRQRKSG